MSNVFVSPLNAPFVPSMDYPEGTVFTWAEFLALPSDAHIKAYEQYFLACARVDRAREALFSAERQVEVARKEWADHIEARLAARFGTGRN